MFADMQPCVLGKRRPLGAVEDHLLENIHRPALLRLGHPLQPDVRPAEFPHTPGVEPEAAVLHGAPQEGHMLPGGEGRIKKGFPPLGRDEPQGVEVQHRIRPHVQRRLDNTHGVAQIVQGVVLLDLPLENQPGLPGLCFLIQGPVLVLQHPAQSAAQQLVHLGGMLRAAEGLEHQPGGHLVHTVPGAGNLQLRLPVYANHRVVQIGPPARVLIVGARKLFFHPSVTPFHR